MTNRKNSMNPVRPSTCERPTDDGPRDEKSTSGTADCDVVFVSGMVGDGTNAHRLVKVRDWTLAVWREYGDDEPRMDHREAARRLGYENHRDFKKVIEAVWPENKRPHVREHSSRTSMPRGGKRIEKIEVYFLTQAQILKLCAKARGKPIADAILDDMIAVYIAAKRGLQPVATAPALDPSVAVLTSEVRSLRGTVAQQSETIQRLETKIDAQKVGDGVSLGKRAAKVEILKPVCVLADRLAKADPIRSRQSWLAKLHLQMRDDLKFPMHKAWALFASGHLDVARGWIACRSREIEQREDALRVQRDDATKARQQELPLQPLRSN